MIKYYLTLLLFTAVNSAMFFWGIKYAKKKMLIGFRIMEAKYLATTEDLKKSIRADLLEIYNEEKQNRPR